MKYTVEFEASSFKWGLQASNKIDKLNDDELLILDDVMALHYWDEEPTADDIDDLVKYELHCCRNSYGTVCGYDTIFLYGDEQLDEYVTKYADDFELGYAEVVF